MSPAEPLSVVSNPDPNTWDAASYPLNAREPIFFHSRNDAGSLLAELTFARTIERSTHETATYDIGVHVTAHPELKYRFRATRITCTFASPATANTTLAAGAQEATHANRSTQVIPRIIDCRITAGKTKYPPVLTGSESKEVPLEAPPTIRVERFDRQVTWVVEEEKQEKAGLPLSYDVVIRIEGPDMFKAQMEATGELRPDTRGLARAASSVRRCLKTHRWRDLHVNTNRFVQVAGTESGLPEGRYSGTLRPPSGEGTLKRANTCHSTIA